MPWPLDAPSIDDTPWFDDVLSGPTPASLGVLQAEVMEQAGPYAATVTSPFSGVGMYGNDDAVSSSFTFPSAPGLYRVVVTGASSSANTARRELLLSGAPHAICEFSGTGNQVSAAELTLEAGAPATQTPGVSP